MSVLGEILAPRVHCVQRVIEQNPSLNISADSVSEHTGKKWVAGNGMMYDKLTYIFS